MQRLELSDVSIKIGRAEIVSQITFSLAPGESVGLIGGSGSGKTTVARAILGLIPLSHGLIKYGDMHRQGDISAVFQNPTASLNPRMTVQEILTEPLVLRKDVFRPDLTEALVQVGLEGKHLKHYPSQLSGGQCQRVCLARALITTPKLLVCDEALTSLDKPTQQDVGEVLREQCRVKNTSLLFISHDLGMVSHLCDYVLVMERGRIVESGKPDVLFAHPYHDYTKELVEAASLSRSC